MRTAKPNEKWHAYRGVLGPKDRGDEVLLVGRGRNAYLLIGMGDECFHASGAGALHDLADAIKRNVPDTRKKPARPPRAGREGR